MQWPSGRALDSESRGSGFDPHKGHGVVSLSKTHLFLRVQVNTQRKWWLHPDMTEKLLAGKLNLKSNKSCSGTVLASDHHDLSCLPWLLINKPRHEKTNIVVFKHV